MGLDQKSLCMTRLLLMVNTGTKHEKYLFSGRDVEERTRFRLQTDGRTDGKWCKMYNPSYMWDPIEQKFQSLQEVVIDYRLDHNEEIVNVPVQDTILCNIIYWK